jgi:hypothetical protein
MEYRMSELGQILTAGPEVIVQRQVDAFNARDLEAFLATYDPAVELYDHPDSLSLSGLESMRSEYGALFERVPEVHVDIVSRIVHGRYVIDLEHVTGLPDGYEARAVALCEVQGEKIRRVWFISD